MSFDDWILAFEWDILWTTKADHFFAHGASLNHHHSAIALIARAGCIAFDGCDCLAIDSDDDSHM